MQHTFIPLAALTVFLLGSSYLLNQDLIEQQQQSKTTSLDSLPLADQHKVLTCVDATLANIEVSKEYISTTKLDTLIIQPCIYKVNKGLTY